MILQLVVPSPSCNFSIILFSNKISSWTFFLSLSNFIATNSSVLWSLHLITVPNDPLPKTSNCWYLKAICSLGTKWKKFGITLSAGRVGKSCSPFPYGRMRLCWVHSVQDLSGCLRTDLKCGGFPISSTFSPHTAWPPCALSCPVPSAEGKAGWRTIQR